jgi:hypothetical protein
LRGRYEVAAELARGGMAVLHVARARGPAGFEKHVVLKRIAPAFAHDDEFVEMFLNEARLAATLEHPHVVTVYDLGEDDVGPYLVMEYVHGVDLFGLLRAREGEPVPLGHALTIAIAVAGGLHHAHGRGIVHRDVSPRNILVSYDGAVKVADFGIAKAITHRTQTRPSVRKGKVGYMAPEQCRGEPITAKCDVYALGVVLHELLTGRRLFRGDDEFAIMNAIVNHDAEPPSAVRSDVPAVVDAIAQRALARRPDERTSSARELQQELEAAAAQLGITPSLAALGEFVADVCGRRPYPWEEPATAARERDVDPRDVVETRVDAAPRTDARAGSRSGMLAVWGAAATVVGGIALWVALARADGERVGEATEPVRATERASGTAARASGTGERASGTGERASGTGEHASGTAQSVSPSVDPPSATAGPPTATQRDVEMPAARESPRRDARRRPSKPKAAAPQHEAAAFDPDGLGPLPTLLER